MSTSSPMMMIRGERGQEAEEGSLVAFGDHLFPGFQFKPTDVEILDLYLRNRLMSSSSATVASCLIQEFDVYSTEPWNLQCDSFRYLNEEKAMHFFTPRHPTRSGSRRANRTAGCGFWHGNGRDNHIKVGSRLIGHKTPLTFMILKGNDHEKKIKTNWIMHEFRLHSPNNIEEFDGMVLCKIYKKRSNNCCTEGEEEEAEQRLGKRKRVEGHACLMAENDEAGISGIAYSESSGQHESLLFAASSSSSSSSLSGSAPLASTNVSAPEGDDEALKRRVLSRLLEEYALLTGKSGVVYPEPSTQDALLFSSAPLPEIPPSQLCIEPASLPASLPEIPPSQLCIEPASLPEIPPSQLCKEPEGLPQLTVDDFEVAPLSSPDNLPPLTVEDFDFEFDFDFDNLSSLDELFGDLPTCM